MNKVNRSYKFLGILIGAFLIILAIFIFSFLNAKPVFGAATLRPIPQKNILSYTFDGFSFKPLTEYAARNYIADEDHGQGSKVDAFYNTINDSISKKLVGYLDKRYNEYFVSAQLIENTNKRSVINFTGDAIPIDGTERIIIEFDLIIDWKIATENNGDDFIQIITKMPYKT